MTSHRVQLIALTFEDNSVGIMQFFLNPNLPKIGQVDREASDVNVNSDITKTDFGQRVMSWRRITPDEVPKDRTYRDAWTDDGKAIEHDIEKAKVIHIAILRRDRAAALVELDAQWMKAVGQGDIAAQAAVEKERQKWRDAPADPRIEAAATVDDLKKIFSA